MALIVGNWEFGAEAPSLLLLVERLRAQTALSIEISGTGAETTLRIPLLREALFDWTFAQQRVAVSSFAPAHPYLWENLDAAMAELGGRVVELPYSWRPDPANRGLRRPWPELTSRQRWLLRLPSIAMARPLDRLARPAE